MAKRSWANLAELRKRLEDYAEVVCREEGLEGARVVVRVSEPHSTKPRVVSIEVEVRPDVDGTDPVWEPIRGRKWEGN